MVIIFALKSLDFFLGFSARKPFLSGNFCKMSTTFNLYLRIPHAANLYRMPQEVMENKDLKLFWDAIVKIMEENFLPIVRVMYESDK